MPKKVLFCATVDYHFKSFHLPFMKWFKDQGWEVHVAANGEMKLPHVDEKYNIPVQRSPIDIKNIKAYYELRSIIKHNQYEIIHCHTPMGGILARLAARGARKSGTKVIYTAHGFHFCKGAPLISWLVYYPIEKVFSYLTDYLITINEEDYRFALKREFNAKRIKHVHGVGVNTETYRPLEAVEKERLRTDFGFRSDDTLLFYAAEFNKNKNQKLLIEALALIKDEVPRVNLILAGNGSLLNACKILASKLGVEDKVHFVGYRNDLQTLLPICDISVASSLREGLPVNIMEAMACGLPVVASDNRGHRELIVHNKTGWIIAPDDIKGMAEKLAELIKNKDQQLSFGQEGRKRIESMYSLNKVLSEKQKIYGEAMKGGEDLNWAVR